MAEFEAAILWSRALGTRADVDFPGDIALKGRTRLSGAFFALRERASTLANEIGRDLPSLTVHDLTHIDALWETADKVAGPACIEQPKPFLNPLEAFLLGAAFLLHDLAQSRAALQMTDDELRGNQTFSDIFAETRGRHEQQEQAWADALMIFMRENHAELSAGLLQRSWDAPEGIPKYLLPDEELRTSLARVIGQLAASHHLSVTDVGNSFNQVLGAPVFLPDAWDCDLLKLACLIRIADATHLDARRAPTFLAALRQPSRESADHWNFQTKLNRVRREGDRLVYTSGIPFPIEQINAWWLCYDALQLIDRELREIDALLADRNKSRYEVRSVAGADDPRRLAALVPTDGWLPVDTQIRVGNVADLVERLGGKQLYGNNLLAPLREMIQNASDAVQARRILESKPDSWGEVVVRLHMEGENHVLSVSDSGVGMSASVLTGALLDFGTSFWSSSEARRQFPGLKSKKFASTGRYGVGFFSAFMLGSKVKVISRRYDLGASEARVLQFEAGSRKRPVLRSLQAQEPRSEGTTIQVVLEQDPYEDGGLLSGDVLLNGPYEFGAVCAWLCPTLPVDLVVSHFEKTRTVVKADDWRTIEPKALLDRLDEWQDPDDQSRSQRKRRELEAVFSKNMRPLYDSQERMVGRMALNITPPDNRYLYSDMGVITVGGCRAATTSVMSGVVAGVASRAARDAATPCYSRAELVRWMQEQVHLVIASEASLEDKASVADLALHLGVDTTGLPLVLTADGWLDTEMFSNFAARRSEIFFMPIHTYSSLSRLSLSELGHNVAVCESSAFYDADDYWLVDEPRVRSNGGWKGKHYKWTSVEWHLIKVLSKAWAVPLDTLEKGCDRSSPTAPRKVVVGFDRFGNIVEEEIIDLFRRPKPTAKRVSNKEKKA